MSGAGHTGALATVRSLAQLTAGFAAVPAEVLVSDVTLDSRAATPGALFLACRGRTHHGVEFAADAVARGARAVLYERDGDTGGAAPQLPTGTFVAAVPKLTERAGVIADRFFGAPSQQLTVAGITGTNGKTTCAWLLAQALPQAVLDTVTSLAFAIDAKDHYTQGHSQKVSAYASLIAEALGLSDLEIEEIRLGGVLHDIGKVAIPENILNKNGPLNPDEWDTMKSHVTFGAKILEPLTPLARIREMVLHHHEFFDGSGYPNGMSGENIPLGARIIAVADAYDTITSDRTYKKARPAAEALVELERCANAQFDAKVVAAFVRTMKSMPNPIIEVASLTRSS